MTLSSGHEWQYGDCWIVIIIWGGKSN